MAAKKSVAPNEHVLILTHTERMQRALSDNPKHPRKSEYAQQMKVYAGQWAGLSSDQKKAAKAAASEVDDMTPKTLSAAVKSLEG